MRRKSAVNSELAPKALPAEIEGFGGRVRDLRKAAGLSQEQLATRVGVNASAVSRWERDEGLPEDPVVLVRLARAVRASIDYVLTGRLVSGVDDLIEELEELAAFARSVRQGGSRLPEEATPEATYTPPTEPT